MRRLGVSYRSAWLVKHKIMEAMRLREDRRAPERDGRMEMDGMAEVGGDLRPSMITPARVQTRRSLFGRLASATTVSNAALKASTRQYRVDHAAVCS